MQIESLFILGAVLGMDRLTALQHAMQLLSLALKQLDELGLGSISLCPETMGKFNQLGNSEEVIALCQLDTRLIPGLDFGHLYCRSLGKLNTFEAWKKELNLYIHALGYERMKHFHSHFSKMLYTEHGGEKCHVTFAQKDCGPDFEVLARVLLKLNLEPRIICESAGTQSIDAKQMKDIYTKIKENL